MEREDVKVAGIAVLILLAVGALAAAVTLIQAHNESKTYNRLTGAQTTTWDAIWVELRVQGEVAPKEPH